MAGILVHEWLAATGGSENVYEALVAAFPDAARLCLWDDSRGRFGEVEETFLAKTPLRRSKVAAMPLMPLAWRHLPPIEGDWLLCSSHLFAHHAVVRSGGRPLPKLLYVHTPARYIWNPELDARGAGAVTRLAARSFKPLDRRRSGEALAIAANSNFVKQRISAAWGRDSVVIYPPVDVERFAVQSSDLGPEDSRVLDQLPADFLLGASRFVEYKRLDRAIRAGAATGLDVVIAGEGPDEPRLRALSDELGARVTFVARPSTELLAEIYRRARALVFGAIEDFGIMPVECMATGTPVVGSATGGTSETILHGQTGALVEDWTDQEVEQALRICEGTRPVDCKDRAHLFDNESFRRAIRTWVSAEVGLAT